METMQINMPPVLEIVTEVFKSTVENVKACIGTVDQFEAISKGLQALQPRLTPVDAEATASWMDEVSFNTGLIAIAMKKLEDGGLDDFALAEVTGNLVTGLQAIERALISGASSLAFREVSRKPTLEVFNQTENTKKVLIDVAFDLHMTETLLREAAGFEVTGAELGFSFPQPRYCGGKCFAGPDASVASLKGEEIDVEQEGVGIDALEVAQKQIKDIPEKLTAVLEALVMLFLLLIAFAVSCTCAAQCTATKNTLIGNTLAKSYAVLVATRRYQPKMDVTWSYCCWNWCWIFWWDKWLTTVTTTHNLGAVYALKTGRPIGVAQTVAKQRAAGANLAALTAPANPC